MNDLSAILQRKGRIDALVKCAAFRTAGSVEDTSVEELRMVVETKYLGSNAMIRMSVMATHSQKDIEDAFIVLEKEGRKIGLIN